MKVLVACEESQEVCKAFRELGHEAYSQESQKLWLSNGAEKGEKMRIETVDYGTHYRKYYFCQSCDIEIGHKTFDANRQFGQGTILHSNEFPNYCPNCGAKMDERECDNA